MDISAHYIDARNALTQPDRMVFVSQYFRRHWMGRLGPLGTAIVIYLRGACYHNRKSGETRDAVQLPQREIAGGCGCSVPTLKRELEHNEALRRFVTVSHEWERDGATGRVRQMENHYRVAMDDPLTEADEERLREMVAERARREPDGQDGGPRDGRGSPGGPSKRIRRGPGAEGSGSTACSTAAPAFGGTALKEGGSDAVLTACSKAQNGLGQRSRNGGGHAVRSTSPPGVQNELLRPGAHFERGWTQNELLLEESLPQTTSNQTFNVGAGFDFVAVGDEAPPEAFPRGPTDRLERQAAALVTELGDFGSERRHRQLLSICEREGLSDLPGLALQATRERLAKEGRRGVVAKPGAYYARVLVSLLAEHQVFVPTAAEAGEDDPAAVRAQVRASLGLDA